MKTRIKSVFVLLATLAIGIAIGVMAWSAVHNMQLERTRSLRSRGALEDVIVGAIGPLASEKEVRIREIIGGVADELNDLFRQAYEARTHKLDSMRQQLNEILSDEEQAKLDAWSDRNRRSARQSGRRDSSAQSHGRRGSSEHNGGREDASAN